MTLRLRVFLALLVVAMVPAIASLFSYRTSQQQLATTVYRVQSRSAKELARYVEKVVHDARRGLEVSASYLPLPSASIDEIEALLAIPYQQHPQTRVVALFNSAGQLIAPPARRRPDEDNFSDRTREVVSDDSLKQFASHLPPLDALKNQRSVVGNPYQSGIEPPRFSIVVRLDEESQRILTAEFTLSDLSAHLVTLLSANEGVILRGKNGEVFLRTNGMGALKDITEQEAPNAGRREPVMDVEGKQWTWAAHESERLGWRVEVFERTNVANALLEKTQRDSFVALVLGLSIALALGFVLSHSLSKPLADLSTAVKAFGPDNLSQRTLVNASGEVGDLARAFNAMANEIEHKSLELVDWNVELQARVAEKSRELRKAHNQILHSQKMTALGTMTAGLSHELNNPLMGLLAVHHQLKKSLSDEPQLQEVVDMGGVLIRRISALIGDFSRLSTRQEAASGAVSAITAVKLALESRKDALLQNDVRYAFFCRPDVPNILAQTESVVRLLGSVIDNAIEAMPQGGIVKVEARDLTESACQISVSDAGEGIPSNIIDRVFDPFFTTKSSTEHSGMGLPIAHQIAEELGGKIEFETNATGGVTVKLFFAAPPQHPHLE